MNNSDSAYFTKLLSELQKDYPKLNFKAGTNFSCNNSTKTITYQNPANSESELIYSNKLLHELAHAKLNHQNYLSDLSLIKLESAAWDLTKDLCQEYQIKFSKKEAKEALQSYINWAASRSTCPNCTGTSLQITKLEFACPNCNKSWKVSTSRFTRTYRQS